MAVMNDVAVRPMWSADVESVVAVHLKAFPGFFLSSLGAAFLRELYQAIVADPSGIGYVYEQAGSILGFVAGTSQPLGFYRRLIGQRWWRFGLAAVMPVLRQPAIVPRLWRAFALPEQAGAREDSGILMSIAVFPGEQGKGIGHLLAKAFLREATRRGCQQVSLTTDKLENDAANAFYRALGFTCVCSYTTPEGREMNEYLISLLTIRVSQ